MQFVIVNTCSTLRHCIFPFQPYLTALHGVTASDRLTNKKREVLKAVGMSGWRSLTGRQRLHYSSAHLTAADPVGGGVAVSHWLRPDCCKSPPTVARYLDF